MVASLRFGGLALFGASPQAVAPASLPPAPARPVDFAQEVRPILSTRCHPCHGPEKQKSGLRLDTAASARQGGELGPDILPGKSAESRLIHFVSGLDPDRIMPPQGDRLTPVEIGILRAWIDQGAVWNDEPDSPTPNGRSPLWTFQPAIRPAVPVTADTSWPRNPIDQFILRRLEQEHLQPSPEADRTTLIRRLSFDLRGLPPSIEEVDEFLSDPGPRAYEHLVDRFLASPRYGERWARHWLDLVHYGESHGYDKDKPRRNAWPYRDYVIRSFNRDTPYSRFVQEQLAGDVLFPDDPDGVIATGFIAAGPWDFVGHVELPESKTDGLIARYNDRDDMVMTTMSTFQSLTVHCARCHNHKFDPILQQDYYNLQAVFAGVDRADRDYDTDPAVFIKRRSWREEKKKLEARKKPLTETLARVSSPDLVRIEQQILQIQDRLKSLPQPAKESPGNGYHSAPAARAEVEKWVQVELDRPTPLDEIRLIPARPTDFPDTPGFGFPRRFRIEAAASEDFRDRRVLADHTDRDVPNPGDTPFVVKTKGETARFVRITATRLWERTDDFVFALAELQILSNSTNQAFGAAVTALDSIEGGRWGKARLVDNYDSRKPLGDGSSTEDNRARRQHWEQEKGRAEVERDRIALGLLDENIRAELASTNERLDETNRRLEALPKPQTVFAAASEFKPSGNFIPPKAPRPVHLLRRGEVKSPGDLATAGSLNCLPGLDGHFALLDPAAEGSRRAALAQWLIDPRNILTRRSIVNRLWQFHFGRGLVDTPNDFGSMGSRPTHPELLDWLAFWFLDHGESLKALHRLMLTSSTYRQSSQPNPAAAKVDGDNRWLWRMNRQRLDAESLHDAILQINGQIDLTMGGPSVEQFFFKDDHSPVYDYTRFAADDPGNLRRSVYRFIVRSVPDPFMECLDSADPALLTPKRNATLTALQALATMNHPFVVRQAERFAETLRKSGGSLTEQVALGLKLVLLRPPQSGELEKLTAYAAKHGMANTCRVLLNTNEFMFID